MSGNQAFIHNSRSDIMAVAGNGFGLPRLTTPQRLALTLSSTDSGVTVMDTDIQIAMMWNGTSWGALSNDTINLKSFGAVGDGVTNDTVAVNLAIAQSLSSGIPLSITSGTYLVTGNSISTSNVEFRFSGGVFLVVGGTWSVVGTITAGSRQIVSSSLSTPVSFARGAGAYAGPGTGIAMFKVIAEWFGAKGDGSTDNALTLQQWINSAGNGMSMNLSGGLYNTTAELSMPTARFNLWEGNGSRIIYTGVASASSAVLRFATTALNLEFNRIAFDANSLAGYAVAHIASGNVTQTQFIWRRCYFTRGTVCNYQLGNYSTSGFDYDVAGHTFDQCVWEGITGSTNCIIDGLNVVNVAFRSCLLGFVSTSNRPTWNLRLLTCAICNMDNCFTDRVDLPGYSIFNQNTLLTVTSGDTETVRFLYQASTQLSPTNLETIINTLRIANAGGESFNDEFAIMALSGTVKLCGALLNSSAYRFAIRVDGKLSMNASWIAGSLVAGVPTPSLVCLANPQRCDIDGVNPASWKPVMMNGNPYMNLWNGSAVGDMPVGYKTSTAGTQTIQQAGTGSGDWPKNNFGRYTAKVTVTVGSAPSSGVIDGMMCRVRVDSRRGPGPYSLMVSGYAESMTGATAPKISIVSYSWTGAAWTTASIQTRTCYIDSAGRFWGVVEVTQADSNIQSGYIEAYVGMGVAAATGTLFVSEFIVARMDGASYADTSIGNYPDLGKLMALSCFPKQSLVNGNFANGSNFWTVPSGWSVSGGFAIHTTGVNVLSQDIGAVFKTRRTLLSFVVSNVTAGSVTPKVCGVAGVAVSTNTTSNQEFICLSANQLLEFVPTTDFDGKISAVILYMVRQNGDDSNGSEWVSAGQLPIGDQGMNLVAANLNLNPNRIIQGTAAPLVGDWKAGDMVINTAPASASPAFWMCSASGTPGTWKAGPNVP